MAMALTTAAQTARYDIFVMKGCANCALTKKALGDGGKQFVFHPTDSANVGRQMLMKLKQLGYTGNILMPVIVMNDTVLLHPAQKNNGLYSHIPLNTVLKSLTVQNTDTAPIETDTHHSSCEFTNSHTVYYIVCGSFDNQQQAAHMTKVLVNRGYPNASFIFSNGLYRTYCRAFDNAEEAKEELDEIKRYYRGAFILSEELK